MTFILTYSEASEVAPFATSVDVCSQWDESDFEELTTVGHTMITSLGTWFAKKYTSQFSVPKVMFRCSKSGRATESGLDFVKAFNAVISKEVRKCSLKSSNYFISFYFIISSTTWIHVGLHPYLFGYH